MTLPHQLYAEAVAYVDGPGGPYAPDDWFTERGTDGRLMATFVYRSTEPPTGQREAAAGDQVVNGQAWPHGVELYWDSVDGWQYAGLTDQDGDVDFYEPLPVDKLASPAALRAVLVPLLDGREDDLPTSTEQWQQPQAMTLLQILESGSYA
ncbi:hypothetical protein ACEZDB_35610 [Streptacidiphilus sp. N1-3]|uniref:Immunity protein Imm1 n=1 Tax=Streptacidiphilus alkalitolerans TaxID=3342712 RepID=A0ABV6XD42_9ACTN